MTLFCLRIPIHVFAQEPIHDRATTAKLRCGHHWGRSCRSLPGAAAPDEFAEKDSAAGEAARAPLPAAKSRRGHCAIERLLSFQSARPRRAPASRAFFEIQPPLLLENARTQE